MIINIKVYPRAKRNQIKKEGGVLKIYTTSPAIDNKANVAVKEMLAEFFQVKKRQIEIKQGERSKQKVIKIIEQ